MKSQTAVSISVATTRSWLCIWGEEGVHAEARQDVENGVDHISIEVIGTVITGIKLGHVKC